MKIDPGQAFRRFGLGRRGAEPVPDDALGWIHAQLDAPDPLLERLLPSTANGILVQRRWDTMMKAGGTPGYGMANLLGDEMTDALRHASTTDLQVRERLVWFWANHFTASTRAGNYTFGLAGAFLQEAIRPHVTGKFSDLLKAVMRHPAMLYYLDNHISDGPHSPLGLRMHLGLNENLARECLELHTLGINGGYTQADVTAFATILTGRTIDFKSDTPGFGFNPDAHEPGRHRFMGHEFPEGLAGSEQVLEWLSAHPATQHHLATQLVRHFVADDPPAGAVAEVKRVLRDTDGDLKKAVLAIAEMPEAWVPLTKFRNPVEYIVAVVRALDLAYDPNQHLYMTTVDLGQTFMGPLLPNGWPDTAENWLSGESLLKRADWAMTQASREGAPTFSAVMEATLGELCSSSTRQAIDRCPNPAEAMATLLASPEFLRR